MERSHLPAGTPLPHTSSSSILRARTQVVLEPYGPHSYTDESDLATRLSRLSRHYGY
jgi:hypothetical protein